MSSKIIYERFLWFHHEVKRGRYPNTKTLAQKFEITRKTAQRDIEFMRCRLGAPLVYLPEKRGFAYEDNAYELPGFWLEKESLTSLMLAYPLASAVPDRTLKASLRAFLEQPLEKISFQKRISLTPHNAQTTVRDILPLHLLHYMGTWHIIAHCALKDELRDFVLSRVKTVVPAEIKIDGRFTSEQVREDIRRTFGIFHGGFPESRQNHGGGIHRFSFPQGRNPRMMGRACS